MRARRSLLQPSQGDFHAEARVSRSLFPVALVPKRQWGSMSRSSRARTAHGLFFQRGGEAREASLAVTSLCYPCLPHHIACFRCLFARIPPLGVVFFVSHFLFLFALVFPSLSGSLSLFLGCASQPLALAGVTASPLKSRSAVPPFLSYASGLAGALLFLFPSHRCALVCLLFHGVRLAFHSGGGLEHNDRHTRRHQQRTPPSPPQKEGRLSVLENPRRVLGATLVAKGALALT